MVDKEQFSSDVYRLEIVGRNVNITEAMKNYLRDKIAKIERFHNKVIDIHVTMDIQKLEHSIMILVHFSHFEIRVHASSTDMYATIDKAVHRLQRKLSRWKDKIQDHHNKPQADVDLEVNVYDRPYDEVEEFNEEIEAQNLTNYTLEAPGSKISGQETHSLRTLTSEEAVMKMELSEAPFQVFRGEEDQVIKVIYRRPDGKYGIIQTK